MSESVAVGLTETDHRSFPFTQLRPHLGAAE